MYYLTRQTVEETVGRSWSDACAKSEQPIICRFAGLRLKIINDVVYYLTRQTVKETVRRSWSDACAKSGQLIICWVAGLEVINDVMYYLTRQTVEETVRRFPDNRLFVGLPD